MKRKGQSVLEFGVLIGVIAVALIAMQTYLKRGIQGKLRDATDSIGGQYDPQTSSSDFTMTQESNMTTNSTTQPTTRLRAVPGGTLEELVDITTTIVQTHYDNTVSTGSESVPNP